MHPVSRIIHMHSLNMFRIFLKCKSVCSIIFPHLVLPDLIIPSQNSGRLSILWETTKFQIFIQIWDVLFKTLNNILSYFIILKY